MSRDFDLSILARNLLRARHRRGMTQTAVAARCGLQPASYGRFEQARMWPSVRSLRRVCLALHVSADVLLEIGAGAPGAVAWADEPPELRLLLRRLQGASPETMRLTAVLLAALERHVKG